MLTPRKLTSLHPQFLSSGGPGITRNGEPVPHRAGVGVMFDCPCGCGEPCYVPFANPISGGTSEEERGWQRVGETFETLTLTPSILRSIVKGGCGWHGFVTAGVVISC